MKAIVLHTDGRGLWSREQRAVRIVDMDASIWFEGKEADFGELRVKFDKRTWTIDKHGLIYTDKLFLKELHEFLEGLGLPGNDVDYSEQGMQGDDYVSLDIGSEFCKKYLELFPDHAECIDREW